MTGGTVIEYPPEIYSDPSRAIEEAERWAWILSGAGWIPVERPFEGRWRVADRDVRLVPVQWPAQSNGRVWVGTFWDRRGTPDPEAVLLGDREEARAWVLEPPTDQAEAVERQDMSWFASATYLNHGEEEYAVAHLAKVVS